MESHMRLGWSGSWREAEEDANKSIEIAGYCGLTGGVKEE